MAIQIHIRPRFLKAFIVASMLCTLAAMPFRTSASERTVLDAAETNSCSTVVPRDLTPVQVTQFGSDQNDRGVRIALNEAEQHLVATGTTRGKLGNFDWGSQDVWFAELSVDSLQDTFFEQVGTSQLDSVQDMHYDPDGVEDYFLVGATGISAGADVRLQSVAVDDNQHVEGPGKILGDPQQSDGAFAVAASDTRLYVGGWTTGALAGSNAGGNDIWLGAINRLDFELDPVYHQWGSAESDRLRDIAVIENESGVNVYGVGRVGVDDNEDDDFDGWIEKYNAALSPLTYREIGDSSERDEAVSIVVDGDAHIYVAGETYGNVGCPNQGGSDIWLVKYDRNLVEQWRRQFGSSVADYVHDMAVDANGIVYLVGETNGDLAGSAGDSDIWLAAYDGDGNQDWLTQLGTSEDDVANGIAVSADGNDIYVIGETEGSWSATQAGRGDVLVLKLRNSETAELDGYHVTPAGDGLEVDGKAVAPGEEEEVTADSFINDIRSDLSTLFFMLSCRSEATSAPVPIARFSGRDGMSVRVQTLPENCPDSQLGAAETAQTRVDRLGLVLQKGAIRSTAETDNLEYAIVTQHGGVYSLLSGNFDVDVSLSNEGTQITNLGSEVEIVPTSIQLPSMTLKNGESVTVSEDEVGPVIQLQRIYLPSANKE